MSEPLVDVTGVRRRKEQERMRRRLWIAGVVAAIAAVVGLGAWVVLGSGLLAVKDVRVTGNTLADIDTVRVAAAVPLGAPLATLDTAQIEARVADQVASVASVRVSRTWPDAVTIAVTEASPSLVLELPDAWVWIDGQGRSFHTTTERPEGSVVARGALEDEQVLATLAAVSQAVPAEVMAQAEALEARSVDSVVVLLQDDRRIVWGSAEQGDLKAAVLVPLLAVEASEYDVSAPTHPTTR